MASTPRVARPDASGPDAISTSVLAHQPALLEAFQRLYGTLWSHGVLEHAAKEVARIRNARVTGCSYCRNVRFSRAREEGLSEELVTLVDEGFERSHLSERLKLVIRYADVFLRDPHDLDENARTAMRQEFTPAEIVELTAGLALFMGFSKIAVVLGLEPTTMPTTVLATPDRPG